MKNIEQIVARDVERGLRSKWPVLRISESRAGNARQAVSTRNPILPVSVRKVALLGNHLPRQCGIATFTTDLAHALSAEYSALECFVLAMNEPGHSYDYPSHVRYELSAADLPAYPRAASFLNAGQVDVACVQHEYGIFGGSAGGHVLALLRELKMPVVATLHTLLAAPDAEQRRVMDELIQLSERLVVMSPGSAEMLRQVHGVPADKIDMIPHGIPSLPDAQSSKVRLGLEGRPIILTFGLLSPGKGIEHVIDSLPAILKRHPDVLYVVLGATHPHVKERDGEAYREMLESRARDLGVGSNVVFHNRFVEQREVTEFLAAADIYITPYLDPAQSTSGTLAYALGSGKAAISTPYAYARELLSDGRGLLVPWPKDDPDGIARAVVGILDDPQARASLCERAATYGRAMLWPEVARAYGRSFERARAEHSSRRHAAFRARSLAEPVAALPEMNLTHLDRLSDETGLMQHAVYSVPRYADGYCLDDNARALLLMTRLQGVDGADAKLESDLTSRYLAFVSHAFDDRSGHFRNFMSYSREWTEARGSEDSHGRALWCLGEVIGHCRDADHRHLADSIFQAALPRVRELGSPRAWAYALLGIDGYMLACPGDRRVGLLRTQLATRLHELYRQSSDASWPWFEARATYGNARLSQALIVSGARIGRDDMTQAGLRSLEWLSTLQRAASDGGYFNPIGSNGFYERGGPMAGFDQQPIEACAMVSACLDAERVTGDARWATEARRAFDWFVGHNVLREALYDASTGACCDGLHADRINRNQGAEATLSFLMALAEMRSRVAHEAHGDATKPRVWKHV